MTAEKCVHEWQGVYPGPETCGKCGAVRPYYPRSADSADSMVDPENWCPACAHPRGACACNQGALSSNEWGGVEQLLQQRNGALAEVERLRAALELWQRQCTGKHGSQQPCAESSQVETSSGSDAQALLKGIVRHWNEFDVGHGLDEMMHYANRWLERQSEKASVNRATPEEIAAQIDISPETVARLEKLYNDALAAQKTNEHRTGALPPEGLITGRAVPTALRTPGFRDGSSTPHGGDGDQGARASSAITSDPRTSAPVWDCACDKPDCAYCGPRLQSSET